MVLKSLRCVCYHCSSLVGDISNDFKVKKASSITKRKTRLEAMHNTLRNKAGKQCDHCGRHQPRYIRSGLSINIEYAEGQHLIPRSGDRRQLLLAGQVMEIFKKLKDEDARKLGLDVVWAKVSY